MHLRILSVALLLAGVGCLAEEVADSSKLAGTWDLDGAGKTTWTLAATDTGVHFIYTRDGQKVADFECNTVGKDCPARMDGKSVKFSVYFNGPHLVMLETRGNDIVKWRFGALAAGQEMEVETTQVKANGKTETQRFKRADVQQSRR